MYEPSLEHGDRRQSNKKNKKQFMKGKKKKQNKNKQEGSVTSQRKNAW